MKVTTEKLKAFVADRMRYFRGSLDCNRSGINDPQYSTWKDAIDAGINSRLGVNRPTDNDGEQSRINKEIVEQSGGFKKSYSQLFNKDYLSMGEFEGEEDLLNAIKNGFDPRLKGLSGGVGSEGGFLLPDEFVARIIDTALEDEIVRPRAMVYGLAAGKGRTMTIPAFEDLNHSTAGIGGVTAQWTAEKAQKAETDPIFRQISMKTNKLVCYTKSSDELVQESGISLNSVIGASFSKAITFYSDVAYLSGSGAGQPLGVLNSPALLVQAAESEQTASTINYDNIIGIFSQLAPSSFKASVWVASISTLPQLMKLSIEVGLGGEHVRILQEDKGKFYLLGKEILFTEKVPALGSQGCLGLYDFSAYGIVMREGLKLESSIHEGFRNDLTAWRAILNVDGQPTISGALTCLDGTTIVSPFVCLGEVA